MKRNNKDRGLNELERRGLLAEGETDTAAL